MLKALDDIFSHDQNDFISNTSQGETSKKIIHILDRSDYVFGRSSENYGQVYPMVVEYKADKTTFEKIGRRANLEKQEDGDWQGYL